MTPPELSDSYREYILFNYIGIWGLSKENTKDL